MGHSEANHLANKRLTTEVRGARHAPAAGERRRVVGVPQVRDGCPRAATRAAPTTCPAGTVTERPMSLQTAWHFSCQLPGWRYKKYQRVRLTFRAHSVRPAALTPFVA